MTVAVMVGVLALLMAWIVWRQRQFAIAQRVLRRLRAAYPQGLHQYSYGQTCEVVTINGRQTHSRAYVVSVTEDGLTLFPVSARGEEPPIRITPDQIRWFGRPRKYTYGSNALWLHVEQEGQWRLVRLRLDRTAMQTLIRTLKPVVSSDPELVTYYRRRRPYVHYGPVKAHPATQDIYGAWQLADAVTLYLTPRYLVVLDGAKVQRVLPLHRLQNVAAVQRIDRPGAEGLVRFAHGEEVLAFALSKHGDFAEALAEAAKRTLEDPVVWQRKKKKQADAMIVAADDDLGEEFLEDASEGEFGEGHLSEASLADGEFVDDEEWLARMTASSDSDDGIGEN